jgi:hypothetical protein
MPAVSRVNDCFNPTWDLTQRLLIELQSRPGTQVSLHVDDDTCLIIEFVEGFGYYAIGSWPSDRDYFNLIESRLGDEITEGHLAHELICVPRHTLVSQATLIRAAKTFYDTGERESTCEWVTENEAHY